MPCHGGQGKDKMNDEKITPVVVLHWALPSQILTVVCVRLSLVRHKQ